ncbi:hypothetical protein [Plantibacter sp. 2H11-2]|jgi:hypothetical protein|uniref:hypothetical protein n=1 Tax=Plantibacter sp. 2H11-2 TaxID=3414431 RepID=UPI003CE8AA27
MIGHDDEEGARPPEDGRPFAEQVLERRGFAITAALFVMLGGLVVPFVGWVAGMVMLWRSRAWTTKQKVWATGGPILASAAVLLVLALLTANGKSTDAGVGGSPVIPVVYDLRSTAVVLLLIGYAAAGAWLLWLALRTVGRRA